MSTTATLPEFRAAGTDLSERRRSGVSKGPVIDLVLPGDDGIIWGADGAATIGAFPAPHENPATDAAIIQYVSTFVPKMTGAHYNPHVSIGVASKEYLDKMLTEPVRDAGINVGVMGDIDFVTVG